MTNMLEYHCDFDKIIFLRRNCRMLYDLHLEEFFSSYQEGEQIYKNYIQTDDASSIDVDYIQAHHMFIPGLSGALQTLDESMFAESDNILIVKHACYMPLFQHSHTFFEMLYVLSGECDNYVDGAAIHLEAGDFCIMAPGAVHALGVFSDSIVINILIRRSTFNETFFDFLSEKSILSDFFWGALFEKTTNPYTVCHSSGDKVMHNAIEMLIYEGMSGNDNYTRKIKENLIRIIFGYMIRNHAENFEFPSVLCNSTETSNEILYYIQENYKSVTLRDLAEHFHYTPPYLSKFIKEKTGMGFLQILNNIRIKNACMLLKNTDLSIHEIYTRSGFKKADVFYKMFKKHTGTSPKEYRQQSR